MFDKMSANQEVIKAINLKTIDTLIAELNTNGFSVTKSELIELAKQKSGNSTISSACIIYAEILFV